MHANKLLRLFAFMMIFFLLLSDELFLPDNSIIPIHRFEDGVDAAFISPLKLWKALSPSLQQAMIGEKKMQIVLRYYFVLRLVVIRISLFRKISS